MKKILICSQKGGVGKSLIEVELAFSFEQSHIPAAFPDLNDQGGTLHRMDQREDAAAAVIDTSGILQKMGTWMSEADAIVIPTETTNRVYCSASPEAGNSDQERTENSSYL